MKESEIKELLNDYVDAEMSYIDLNNYKKNEFEPSDKYKKRIKRLFSIEKYFGKNIRLGYFARRVAIFVICILGLVAANKVSARVFGFDPWKYVTSYFADEKSVQKVYKNKVVPSDSADIKQTKSDFPTYIPEGLVKQDNGEKTDFSCSEVWYNKDYTKGVSYNRTAISKNTVAKTDADYTKKVKCEVGGYVAYYYQKEEENWISWDDENYNYMIQILGFEDSKTELLKIANSIY